MSRFLAWEGCLNTRDLGGLRTIDGGITRLGAIIRSDALDHLTPSGWDALRAYGMRTVIDLRCAVERPSPPIVPPAPVRTLHLPLEDLSDVAFWEAWFAHAATTNYFQAFVARYPERLAEIVRAVARAEPGGVVIHCGVGRDRTGLIALVLLALAGVAREEIITDYAQSAERLSLIYANPARTAALQASGQRVLAEIQRHGARLPADGEMPKAAKSPTADRDGIVTLLNTINVEATLLAAGLTRSELTAVRARLRGTGGDQLPR